MVQRFTAHVSDHSLFPVQQSAYRRFHSTETAILSVHNDLALSADSNHVSLLVLLDLSAAFNTVDHDILLDVLSRWFNITDTAFSWFQSYLSGRTQTVVYNEQQTDIIEIDCSVPQLTPKILWMWSTDIRRGFTCMLTILSCITAVDLMMCRVSPVIRF